MSTRKIFNITVTDSVATFLLRQGRIVCGNDKYSIRFTFDSEWDGQEQKVARFNFAGKHTDVPFTGNEVDVPVISGATEVEVGVYTEDGPFTTTGAVIPCELSILCKPSASSSENDKRYLDEARALVEEAREILANIGDGEGLRGVTEALESVTGELDGKLDKVTTTSDAMRVYTVSADGTKQGALEISHSTSNTKSMICGKAAGGIVKVGDPKAEKDAVNLGYANEHYLAIQPSPGYNAMYGIRPSGEQALFAAQSNNPMVYSLPMRDDGLTFEVGPPIKDTHPATKKYVDDGFVPKTLYNSSYDSLLCAKKDGTYALQQFSPNNIAWNIVIRDAKGNANFGTPTADGHAATKKYVDTQLSAVANAATKRTYIAWKTEIEGKYWFDAENLVGYRGTYAFGSGRYDVHLTSDSDSMRAVGTFAPDEVSGVKVTGDTDAVGVSVCDDEVDFYGKYIMYFWTDGGMGEHFLLDIDILDDADNPPWVHIHVTHIVFHPEPD